MNVVAFLLIAGATFGQEPKRTNYGPVSLFPPVAPITKPVARRTSMAGATATPTIASIYVETTNGVQTYSSDANGALTQVGQPFVVAGAVAGANAQYVITVGTDLLHSYATDASGAIVSQAAQVNTQSFGGAQCGTTAGGILDRTGKLAYVNLNGAVGADGNFVCDAVQSYSIGTDGSLTFIGSTVYDDNRFADPATTMTATPGAFAFNTTPIGQACESQFNTFQQENGGALNALYVDEFPPVTGPTPNPDGWYYYPEEGIMASDGANHLAVWMTPVQDAPCGTLGAPQIASFTVDTQGNLTSTNTWQNMPAVDNVAAMSISPAGNVLAVAGQTLVLYHFNAAAPITPYTTLSQAPADGVAWDASNHLYAIDDATLYVYTATETSAAAAGSYKVASPIGLFVVPR